MNKATIKKPKTLNEQLLSMTTSGVLFIPFREYTEMHVRKIVRQLNKQGFSYKASTAGVIDGTSVTRLR